MDYVAEHKADRACIDRLRAVLSEGEMSRSDLGRRCNAHSRARVQGVIDTLKASGHITETIIRQGRGVRTMLRLSEPERAAHDPLLVRMKPEAVEAQSEAERQLRVWFAELDRTRTYTLMDSAGRPVLLSARDLLVRLYRTPWKYAVEQPVWVLVDDVAEERGYVAAMKAARKLAEMGAIVLKERRGRGRTSTFRLAHIPPYPMA